MWAPVPETKAKEFRVYYDLETFPFEIKSDSEPKSGERLEVIFRSSGQKNAGGIAIVFKQDPPRLEI